MTFKNPTLVNGSRAKVYIPIAAAVITGCVVVAVAIWNASRADTRDSTQNVLAASERITKAETTLAAAEEWRKEHTKWSNGAWIEVQTRLIVIEGRSERIEDKVDSIDEKLDALLDRRRSKASP